MRFMLTALLALASVDASATLLHRWSFDSDGSDSVGGANATLLNGASISSGALQLDGVNDYANLPIDSTLSTLGSFTIETWASYDNLTAWGRILDFGNGGRVSFPATGNIYLTGSAEFQVGNPVSFATFLMTPTSTTGPFEQLVAGAIPGPGEELHYAITVDADTQIGSFYINGVRVVNQSYTLTPADVVADDGNEQNWIGQSRWLQDDYMDGSVNELRIYNSVLSEGEVSASYLAGPGVVVPEPRTWALFGLGLAFIAASVLRRRNS